MSRLSFSLTNNYVRVLKAFKLKNFIGLGKCGSTFSSNYASSSSNYEPLGRNDDDNEERGSSNRSGPVSDSDEKTKESKNKNPSEESGTGVTEKKKESITERLMRMSMESGEDAVISHHKDRKPVEEYYSRFPANPRAKPIHNEFPNPVTQNVLVRKPVIQGDKTKPFRRILKTITADGHNTHKSVPKDSREIIPDHLISEDDLQNSHNQFSVRRPQIFQTKLDCESVLDGSLMTEVTNSDLVQLEDDPNTFGTLSAGKAQIVDKESAIVGSEISKIQEEFSIYTEAEADDYSFVPENRWSDRKLRMKIKELLRQKKFTEALDIFTDALKDKSYFYDKYDLGYMYALLIIECGNVGHVEMAFRLFRDYVKRGLVVKPQVFTFLFNACANSPWSAALNLKRIAKLRETMQKQGFLPNEIHYHSIIKAYGRCGDIQSAFSVVDDMMDRGSAKRVRANAETFAFLLQACISDKENGFRYALVTWKKMDEMRIRPTIFCYNLFLRAIRECGIQLPSSTIKLLRPKFGQNSVDQAATNTTTYPIYFPTSTPITENSVILDLISLNDENPTPQNSQLQQLFRENGNIAVILAKPENRLALLGGIKSIISQMQRDDVVPDLKTVTELLQVVPFIEIADVFALLKTLRLRPDIDFFNLLMKKYIISHKVEEGRAVLELLPMYNLNPNIMTWGVLAIGCSSWKAAQSLLGEMDSANIVPNNVIMGALLRAACENVDPRYVLRVMEEILAREMKPDQRFLEELESFRTTIQQGILNSETGKEVKPLLLTTVLHNTDFLEYWRKFKCRYDSYVKDAKKNLDVVQDPWADDYKMRKLNVRKHELP